MDVLSYYLRRASEARIRAAAERNGANRRAWIEMAEIFDGRCLLYLMNLMSRSNPNLH
jgi:hypothetical protein